MKKAWFWLVLALCIAAVAASAMLLVDYVRPAPVFCDEGGGCSVIRRTVYAHPAGIPTPVFGISGFLAVALAACLPGRRARVAQAALAGIGGAAALFFIGVQLSLQHICPYCMIVDNAALLVLGLSVARVVRDWDPPEARGPLFTGSGLLVAAIGLPLGVGMTRPLPPPPDVPPLPAVIAEEIDKTPKGQVTVVDFVDFECPFCRATHAELAPLLAEYEGKVRVVRKNVPLRMHPHAMDAARAACCGELLGKGDAMADALASVPPTELTPEGCEKIAESLGLDVDRYRACVKDPETDARIRADGETFRAAAGRGLPMLYIGEQRLVGEQDRASLKEALDEAARAL